MTTGTAPEGGATASVVDEWFERWITNKTKLTMDDAARAVSELEELVDDCFKEKQRGIPSSSSSYS